MRSEQECKPQERYLFAEEIFSDESIAIWQGECISRVATRKTDKGQYYNKFVNWKRKDNEIALFTLYAYADLSVPKQFNCIFDINNPARFKITDLVLSQSIYEGWLPTDSLEHGHKHTCVFELSDSIPDMIKELHIATGKFSDAPKKTFRLGICQENDFEDIKRRINYTLGLKKEHGQDWWKYDTEK